MNNAIDDMRSAHPRLREASPNTSDNVAIFAFLNIAIGLGLINDIARTLDFFIINSVTTSFFWGICFLGAGIGLLIARWIDNWISIRAMLLFCLLLKLIWIMALVARQVESPDTNIFLVVMFASLGVFQVSTYLRFPRVESWRI